MNFLKIRTINQLNARVYRDGVALAGKAPREVFDKNLLPTDGVIQDPRLGKYWDPIPDDKFKTVLKK